MVYTATARCRQRDSLLTNGNFFFSLLLKKTAGLWNLMHNTDNSSQPMSACLWLISSTCHAEMAVNHSNCPKPKNCRTRCIVEVAAIPTRAQHLVYALEKGTAHYLFLYAFCIKSSHLHIQRYLWVGGWSVKASQKLGGFGSERLRCWLAVLANGSSLLLNMPGTGGTFSKEEVGFVGFPTRKPSSHMTPVSMTTENIHTVFSSHPKAAKVRGEDFKTDDIMEEFPLSRAVTQTSKEGKKKKRRKKTYRAFGLTEPFLSSFPF